jgi:hypothetical protein
VVNLCNRDRLAWSFNEYIEQLQLSIVYAETVTKRLPHGVTDHHSSAGFGGEEAVAPLNIKRYL